MERLEITLAKLQDDAKSLGYELSQERLARIHAFWQLLFDYNQHTNLVARADLATVMQDHVLDSLTLVEPILRMKRQARLIDIGSGAGFPGLVLAIAIVDLQVTLVEPIGKKARFLQSVVDTVDGLAGRVDVRVDRAEELARIAGFREKFDFATARAVGPMPMIAELALPFLKIGGSLLAQRTVRQLESDMKPMPEAVGKLGGTLRETLLPDSGVLRKEHAVLVVEKSNHTPDLYPRPWSTIKRENQS